VLSFRGDQRHGYHNPGTTVAIAYSAFAFAPMTQSISPELTAALDAVRRAIDETAAEYAQLPFFVRPIVRRGFARRTGRDLAAWRALLAAATRGDLDPALAPALTALAAHYDGAPDRARAARGATTGQLAIIEARARSRAAAARTLLATLRPDRTLPLE
jgi:hypothetical protein